MKFWGDINLKKCFGPSENDSCASTGIEATACLGLWSGLISHLNLETVFCFSLTCLNNNFFKENLIQNPANVIKCLRSRALDR